MVVLPLGSERPPLCNGVPGSAFRVTGQLHRVQSGRRKGFVPEPPPTPVRRPARIAVMLALAHQIQRAIDRGNVRDRAEAARRLGLTRARLTQVFDLTVLAPEVQERILGLEAVDGVEPLSERALRPLGRAPSWAKQRAAFEVICPQRHGAVSKSAVKATSPTQSTDPPAA